MTRSVRHNWTEEELQSLSDEVLFRHLQTATSFDAPSGDILELVDELIRRYQEAKAYAPKPAPVPTFQKGDKVRHKTDQTFYLGEVLEISKTGKTVRVQWTEYDKRTYIFGAPWPAYYRLDKLEKVDPTPNGGEEQ